MKSTRTEVDARVATTAKWLVLGWSRAKICEYARENKGWNVSDSQIDRYIAKARDQIREGFKDDWETNRALAVSRLESLYCLALEKSDLKTALNVIKELIILQKPESSRVIYAHDEDFMLCLYTYAEALKQTLPEKMLIRVNEAVRELEPVAESLDGVMDYDFDEMMQAAVIDAQTLGRTRTREELIEAGFFDGLCLP